MTAPRPDVPTTSPYGRGTTRRVTAGMSRRCFVPFMQDPPMTLDEPFAATS